MNRDERVKLARKAYDSGRGNHDNRMEAALDAALEDIGGLDGLRWFGSPTYHPLRLMQERDAARSERDRLGLGLQAIVRMANTDIIQRGHLTKEYFRRRNEEMGSHAIRMLGSSVPSAHADRGPAARRVGTNGDRPMTDNDPRVEAAMDVLAALAPDGDSPPRCDRGARFVAALRAALRDLDPEPPPHREGS